MFCLEQLEIACNSTQLERNNNNNKKQTNKKHSNNKNENNNNNNNIFKGSNIFLAHDVKMNSFTFFRYTPKVY